MSDGILDLAHPALAWAMKSMAVHDYATDDDHRLLVTDCYNLGYRTFAQATPLYCTGISCSSMMWNSSTISVASSSR